MHRSVPVEASATAIARAVADGATSAEAVVSAALERIAARDPDVHAWQVLDGAAALATARRLDRRWAAGADRGLLGGVPLGVKDILDTADLPTAYGSPIHRDTRPAVDAVCVARARGADAIVLGKTVTTELAYFTPGPTANPHHPGHTPGGSSSGSAAAVADGMVPLAFGTQTAASIVRPASFCGVFGLKPTHGTVPLHGAKPFAPSLDTIGWFARTADDLELMRSAMLGDAFVPLVMPSPTPILVACCTHEWSMVDDGGGAAWEAALSRIARSGRAATLVEAPATISGLLEAQKTVMAFEAARSLAPEMRDHRALLSAVLVGLLESGAAIDEAAYGAALDAARLGRAVVADLMRGADALLVPAAPGEAPHGLATTGDPVFGRVWTLLGLPCVAVPGLTGPKGLPIGMQLVGHPGAERELLQAAAALHAMLAAEQSNAA